MPKPRPQQLKNDYKCSVNLSASQDAGAQNAYIRIAFNGELFDVGNNFDAVTNHVFFAPIDGYYQVNFGIRWMTMTQYENSYFTLRRNAVDKHLFGPYTLPIAYGQMFNGSALIFLAAGDYLDLLGMHDGVLSAQKFGAGSWMTVNLHSV